MRQKDADRSRSDSESDLELTGVTTPGGTHRSAAVNRGQKEMGGREGGGEGVMGEESSKDRERRQKREKELKSKLSEGNRKTVQNRQEDKGGRSESEESGSSKQRDADRSESSEGLISVDSSSNSESESSDSASSQASAKAGKKRSLGGDKSLSSRMRERSGKGEKERSSRYVRQLAKALKIDASWAREVYEECTARGTTSYDGLLRYFYRQQVQHAKGTQKDTTRKLNSSGQHPQYGGVGKISVSMPTFQLPEWSQGQPPNGGVHFSTLQKM
jgi:hypothetical protein